MANLIWPAILTLLTLVLLIGVAGNVARCRGRYGVAAPATTGHPLFERAYRVQMNTIEGTLLFLPALWLAAQWGGATLIAGAGALWLGARVLYAVSYMKDPAKRSLGFGLSMFAVGVLMVKAAIGIGIVLLG